MRSATSIAVTSRSFSKNPVLRAEVLAKYKNVTFNDEGRSLGERELVQFLSSHEKAIVALERLTYDVLCQLPDLRVVSKYGVGLDNIDLKAMKELGKRLGWTPGVNRRSVAELTLALIISALHRVPESFSEARMGKWRQLMGNQLTGKTVGVIGCGNVGKDLVALLQPFQCQILVNDIVPINDFVKQTGAYQVDLELLLEQSDVVTIHVPLNDSTRGMLSRSRLSQLKPTAILINTARGGLIDEQAVKEMLTSNRLAGAAFDVFATEPPLDHELLGLPKFFFTTHIGGSAEEAILAMGRAAISGLETAEDPTRFFEV